MNQIMINELVEGLLNIYGSHLISIILYGSVARGTELLDSDIDIAILLDNINDQDTKDKLLDFVVELDLKYDRVFSVIDIDYSQFLKWEKILPFYRNVKKDGVVLWKVA
ncbi:MAG: nucleotidyltransferase domain-containing protein [Clostridia bacterium]|nr:nucleotidyltransferase domain-containing protein [Clostridia bacterium]